MKLDSVIAQMHEHISDAVLICEAEPSDHSGPRIVWCNRAYTQLSGYAFDEVIGNAPSVLLGEAALQALQQNACDIIFMDLHMPGMAGDTCVERIRAGEDLHAFVPVIMLTADVSGDARKRTQACGADDICSKPFAMDKVASLIGRYLQPKHEPDSKAG